MSELLYEINGNMGKILRVYDDKCSIAVEKSAKAFLFASLLDGEKEFYYKDITSVQFKNLGYTTGYMQFEYPGSHSGNNYVSENSFTFAATAGTAKYNKLKEEMPIIYEDVRKRINEAKSSSASTPQITTTSEADELMKFKMLLDQGIITQSEFELKKQQMLGSSIAEISESQMINEQPVSQKSDVINEVPSNSSVNINPDNIEPTIIRIELLLEKGEWERVSEYSNVALDYFPTDYRLYLFLLLSELRIHTVDDLKTVNESFRDNDNYKLTLRFCDDEVKEIIDNSLNAVEERENRKNEEKQHKLEEERKNTIYNKAINKAKENTIDGYSIAISELEKIGNWRDSLELLTQYKAIQEKLRLENIEQKKELDHSEVKVREKQSKEDDDIVDKLRSIKELYDLGAINKSEFEALKSKLLQSYNIEISISAENKQNQIATEPEGLSDYSDNNKSINEKSSAHSDIKVYGDEVILEGFEGADEWIVLKKNGNNWLLMSKYMQDYREVQKYIPYIWEKSAINEYLNTTFINKFTPNQKERLQVPDDCGTDNILEKVFLMSEDEYKEFFTSRDDDRQYMRSKDGIAPNIWALRSSDKKGRIQFVTADGYINSKDGNSLFTGIAYFGIRPLIWLSVE